MVVPYKYAPPNHYGEKLSWHLSVPTTYQKVLPNLTLPWWKCVWSQRKIFHHSRPLSPKSNHLLELPTLFYVVSFFYIHSFISITLFFFRSSTNSHIRFLCKDYMFSSIVLIRLLFSWLCYAFLKVVGSLLLVMSAKETKSSKPYLVSGLIVRLGLFISILACLWFFELEIPTL